jgi:hypothetical protein
VCAALALALLAACGAEAPAPESLLDGGTLLDLDLALPTLATPKKPMLVRELLGAQATVFYAYSGPCPCVEIVEPRVQALMARYGAHNGVSWVAVAGEPLDTLEQLREKHLRLGSRYRMLIDPQQKLCAQLGMTAACELAVLDAGGRLIYRGALDDHLIEGHGEYLEQALSAALKAKPLRTAQRERLYGCTFGDPSTCTLAAPPPRDAGAK